MTAKRVLFYILIVICLGFYSTFSVTYATGKKYVNEEGGQKCLIGVPPWQQAVIPVYNFVASVESFLFDRDITVMPKTNVDRIIMLEDEISQLEIEKQKIEERFYSKQTE